MHYDIELDLCPAYGWQGGPNKDILIKRLVSGREKRKPQSYVFIHTYILPIQNIAKVQYLARIKNLYMAVNGCTNSFNAKDWGDFEARQEPLGIAPAGSTPVQLIRTYSEGPAEHTRVITKPRADIVVYQNGVAKDGTVDTSTGLFTPTTAWTPTAVLTWSGEFLVPVRFDQMSLQSSIDNRVGADYAINGSVTLIEVLGE